MKRNLMMLLCVVALFASCSTEEQEQLAVSNGTAVSISSAEIPPVGGEVNFTISANTNWRISSKPDWVIVSRSAGSSGTMRMELSANLNTDREDRNGSVVIAANDGSFRESIQVFQEHPYLEISTDKIDFLWDENTTFSTPNKSIDVRCNTEWAVYVVDNSNDKNFEITDYENMKQLDWLLCSSVAGEDDITLTFNPRIYNISNAPHTMRLELSALDREGQRIPDCSHYLNFSQDNLRFLVDVFDSEDDENMSFKACNTDDQTIEIDSELNWSVQSAPAWVTISTREGVGNQTAQSLINIDGANPGATVRTGDIILTCEAGTNPLPTRTIHVSQHGYRFEVDYSTFTADSWDYTETEMPVYSSGSWAIDATTIPSWLNVPVQSGDGEESNGEIVTVEPTGQNFALTNREANILFKSTQAGNNMTLTKKFIQAAYQLEGIASVPAINTYSLADNDLQILSDGEWSATISYEGSVKDWLQISATSGDKDTNITYKALTPNESFDDREAKIILCSETHKAMGEDVTYEVPIKHRKYVFEVTPAPGQIDFSYTAVDVLPSRKTLELECSADWTITCPDWMVIYYNNGGYDSGLQGSGDATLQFAVNNNYETTSRSGKIVIKSVVGQFEYDVTQEGYVFNIPDINLNLGAIAGNAGTFQYTCSGQWGLENCPDWLTFSPAGAVQSPEQREFTIDYDLNPNLSSRSATVKFVSLFDGKSKEFNFTQAAFVFNSTSQSFSYEAINSASNSISVVCTGDWEVVNAPAWVNCSVTSGTGNTSFTIKPSNNTELSARNATFNVRSKLVPSYTKQISVSQKAFVFDTKAVTIELGALDTTQREVAFDYIGADEMTVSSQPAWFDYSGRKWSSSTYTYVFTPKKNTTADARTATITLTSKYNTSLKKTITVKQAGYVFSATPTSVSLKSGDTGANTITVKSTGKWTVATTATWLKLSSTGGTGDGTFTITATANTAKDAKDRSADVVITCSDDTSKKITIKVTQAKPE